MPTIISNHVCKRCGTPIPYDRYRVYCDACTRLNKQESLRRERVCMDCGKQFVGYPKSKRCPECQAEADKRNDAESRRRKAAGKSRRIGERYKCKICGKEYMLASGGQLYCPDCADLGVKVADAAQSRAYNVAHRTEIHERRRAARICIVCGKPITDKHCTVTCGDPACKAARRRAMQREGDARRGRSTHDPGYVITKTARTKEDDT